jgi:hypothetical protein
MEASSLPYFTDVEFLKKPFAASVEIFMWF